MLDVKLLRQDIETIATQLTVKGFTLDVEKFKTLEAKRKESDVQTQSLQAERKKVSKKVGQLIGQGRSVDDAKAEVATELASIDKNLQTFVEQSRSVNDENSSLYLVDP